jgi:hypothetical protein
MGLLNLAKSAVTGTLLPEKHPLVQQRQWLCGLCSNRYLLHPALGSQCAECHCLINLKTRVLEERCPLGAW